MPSNKSSSSEFGTETHNQSAKRIGETSSDDRYRSSAAAILGLYILLACMCVHSLAADWMCLCSVGYVLSGHSLGAALAPYSRGSQKSDMWACGLIRERS